ncbi:hypothetical protein D3C78_1502450 [compost metagenome]
MTEHRIEQRVSAKVTLQLQLIDERFKWIFLVLERFQAPLLHLLEQLQEGHARIVLTADSKRIDEHAH